MLAPAPIADYTLPDFMERAGELVAILRQKSADELAALMKISNSLADLNARRYRDWQAPFDLHNAKQALLAFRGDVYASLDADSLDMAGLEYAQKHLRILSGLYGLLRPLDLMQAYRLEMGTRLAGEHGRDLYAFWGDTLTLALQAELAGHAEKTLVNLASGEYARAVNFSSLAARVVHIHFKEKQEAGYKVVGIHAKRARGMMCRYAIEQQARDAEALQGFDAAGYQYRPELSSEADWVFAR